VQLAVTGGHLRDGEGVGKNSGCMGLTSRFPWAGARGQKREAKLKLERNINDR
jgi:hypothetical protein